ncbi:MAG: DUF1361 domain-containing protein [Anaerolineae bacterium]|jgi:uncharacterized membrane protein|nr:DUF1361 domain-containing protein [Anaerolineae bacterium]
MSGLKTLLHHERRQAAVVASLAFATLLCALMLAARAVYVGRVGPYFGLQWNLFLAWLPMLGALVAYNLGKRYGRRGWPLILPFLLGWLLFFPNAPYILTDFIHLGSRGGAPLWYDLLMVATYALTGLFLGLVSLYLMQSLVRRAFGAATSWVFTLSVLAMTGFGVYLGRFPRWNSWDVLTDPTALLLDVWSRLSNPLANSRTFVFSMLFSLCLAAMYFVMVSVIHLRDENG